METVCVDWPDAPRCTAGAGLLLEVQLPEYENSDSQVHRMGRQMNDQEMERRVKLLEKILAWASALGLIGIFLGLAQRWID